MVSRSKDVLVALEEHYVDVDCALVSTMVRVHLVAFLAWALLAAAWVYNTWVRGESTHLQRFMSVPPLLKVGVSVVAALMWDHCPWSTISAQYVVMVYMGLSTMYQTVLFTVLVLLSKGWTFTRERFTGQEFVGGAGLVCLIYVAVSAHFVESKVMVPILAATYLVIGSVLLGFCFNNLALVAEQFRYVRATGARTLERPLILKSCMFWYLSWVLAFFSVAQCTCLVLQTTSADDGDDSVIWQVGQVALDLAVYFAIALIFRVRPGVTFSVPIGASTSELPRKIAPFHVSCINGSCKDEPKSSLVIIINPSEREAFKTHPWKALMVGARAGFIQEAPGP